MKSCSFKPVLYLQRSHYCISVGLKNNYMSAGNMMQVYHIQFNRSVFRSKPIHQTWSESVESGKVHSVFLFSILGMASGPSELGKSAHKN